MKNRQLSIAMLLFFAATITAVAQHTPPPPPAGPPGFPLHGTAILAIAALGYGVYTKMKYRKK